MKRKRHSTDEVIRKLREAEVLEGQGQTIGQVCQKLEISEQTLHRWRKSWRASAGSWCPRCAGGACRIMPQTARPTIQSSTSPI